MNLNKVFLVGRLTADPETRTTQGGQKVASIRLATNRIWNNKEGQRQEQTEYHTIVAWGGLADVCSKYLNKGQLAMFEGRIQTRSWQDAGGAKHYRTEVIADNMQLGPRAAGTGSRGNDPESNTATNSNNDVTKEEIPVINEDAPVINPTSKPSDKDVDEAEIKLDDIPF